MLEQFRNFNHFSLQKFVIWAMAEFAAALLAALRENSEIIEAQALFAPVRRKVVLNANQTPVYSDIRMAGHDGGEFIFTPQ